MRSLGARLIACAAAFAFGACWPAAAAPDRPGKPEAPTARKLLPVERAILLDGRPFPARSSPEVVAPPPRRTFHVAAATAAAAADEGAPDGSADRPWNDLAEALRKLEPGDRLVLGKGTYAGEFRIDDSCRDGTPEAPIQVVADGATIRAAGSAPALSIGRKQWWLEGIRISGEGAGEALLRAEPGADNLTIDRASLSCLSRPGIELVHAAHVLVANSRVLRQARSQLEALSSAIIVGAGSKDVRFVGVLVAGASGSGLRVGEEGGEPPSDVSLVSSTIRDTYGPAVRIISGRGVRIGASDLVQSSTGRIGTAEGVRVEGGDGVTVEECRIGDFALAVRVGVQSGGKASAAQPRDVVLERSFLESRSGSGSGVAVETGSGVRISNNLLSGFREAFVVFGRPPVTERLTIANNLAIGISRLAFRLDAADSARLFDYNVFSPSGKSLEVEVRGKILQASAFLRGKTMRHTRLAPGVSLRQGDLGAVQGAATVDRGTPLPGATFLGKAPDIGVAER